MYKRVLLGVMATAAMCVSATTLAAGPQPFNGTVTLAKAVEAPSETTIDGVTWRCDGDKCIGRADRRASLDSQMRECQKVAGTLGELTTYVSRGREMRQSSVEFCSKAAGAK